MTPYIPLVNHYRGGGRYLLNCAAQVPVDLTGSSDQVDSARPPEADNEDFHGSLGPLETGNANSVSL